MKSDAKNIGKRLKGLRELSGLNQFEVAEFLGRTDRSAISAIESGYIRLPEKDEQRLIAYLEEKAKNRYKEFFPVLQSAIG